MAKDDKSKAAKPSAEEIAARKAAKKAAAAVEVDSGEETSGGEPAPTPRLIAHYKEKVVPALKQKFGYTNLFEVPKLEKIVISMGLGKFATEGGDGKAKFQQAEKELTTIAGQKPVRCKAKKSVANFKVREGMETGLKVTLRGNRMYEFLDRLISLVIPRVKDFRGLSAKGFDKTGNYNFGFNEQSVFPEIEGAAITFQQGMNITIVSSSPSPEHGRELLNGFGFPFKTEEEKKSKQTA